MPAAPHSAASPAQVSVTEDSEINYWTGALGVTEDALRRAVANAGTIPADVRDYLGVKPTAPMPSMPSMASGSMAA